MWRNKKKFRNGFLLAEKAAEKGNITALANLGEYYELGIEVEKDESKAFDYYKK